MRYFFLCLLFCVACSDKKNTLNFNLVSDSIQLDWTKASDRNSEVILDNIMEGLTTYAGTLQSSTVLHPLPSLASSWTLSEGGKVYRFHLRKDVHWSDGEPLTAQQFVDSWERLLNPATKSENAYHLYEVVNAKNYAEGLTKDFSDVGVRAIDDLTLEVRLRRPVSYFLHLVASAYTFPIRLDLIHKYGTRWTDIENLVTLGAYKLMSWDHEKQLVLKRNHKYWGAKPTIETVVCKTISEPLTAVALYENEELDILPRDLPVSGRLALEKRADYQTGPKLSLSYLAFNTARPPFNKVENRRAFIRSIDRQTLAQSMNRSQSSTTSWIPPGMIGYQKEIGISYSPIKATLSENNILLRYNGDELWELPLQAMQKMLRQNLQANLKLSQMERKDFQGFLSEFIGQKIPKSELVPNILLLMNVADYPDPHSFMNVFTSASESNYTGWKNAHYDELVDRAVSSSDENERIHLYNEAQKLLLEDAAVIMPLFVTNHEALVRRNLQGVVLNPLDKWYFKSIRMGK